MDDEQKPNAFSAPRLYLMAKWRDYKCEVCKTSNWTLLRSDDYPYNSLTLMDKEGLATSKSWKVIGVSCGTCANTKFVLLDTMTKWFNSEEGQKAVAKSAAEHKEDE
ncbi:hypothetical protein GCM10007862_07030 [Dyella lipolytica]|uniref:Uncharacterized protein n=1 Tax=Dyella lipolytica TaxID=1867835 RepID=A0ABW8IZU8_9GAMM|nr:hypothetical protein [Dyella lipolytica]GLQ45652.1 hypothetical protein GCM10007862_07030 [Dyella lipolytica]